MKTVAIMPVRNESWCLGLTLRALLMWVDCVIVTAHSCTDDTHKIMCDIRDEVGSGRLWWTDDRSSVWNEMEQRQQLLEHARWDGATHIVILDADEILTGNLITFAKDTFLPQGLILRLPGYNLRGGTHQYHRNGVWSNRWFSAAFSDHPALHWTGDRFHHREPVGLTLSPWQPIRQGDGGIIHLWGASERRLKAKHAWYRITERLRWPEKPIAEIELTYRYATEPLMGGVHKWIYRPVPESWWAPYAHLMQYLDLDAVPWQEAEIERAIEAHGREHFAGLDLLGY